MGVASFGSSLVADIVSGAACTGRDSRSAVRSLISVAFTGLVWTGARATRAFGFGKYGPIAGNSRAAALNKVPAIALVKFRPLFSFVRNCKTAKVIPPMASMIESIRASRNGTE